MNSFPAHPLKLLGALLIISSCVLSASPQGTPLQKDSWAKETRQVHLDFHTSEHILEIGAHFDKEQFQAALQKGRVNSINIFAKGHHGWSYYPTKVGDTHPHLDFDLLGAQIEACHEIGVRCPFYFTVGLSENDALTHPEWTLRNRDGEISVKHGEGFFEASPESPKPEGQYYRLCPNTGYHEHIMAQIEEICRTYPVDGFWFDIYTPGLLCYCEACAKEMRASRIDLDDTGAVQEFRLAVLQRHMEALRNLILSQHPDATVFFNGTTAIFAKQNFTHRLYRFNSFQDLEDLPTTSWCDYDRLPLQSKHFLQLGYAVTAMSGKFHKGWGEFGGFKHPNAILYEASSMIAWGANCNFGDQLHPSGIMDPGTYRNIGRAYAYVEQIEAYGPGGKPEARVGMWRSFDNYHDEALVKMLLQEQINFEVANDVEDLNQFDLLIIPDTSCLDTRRAKQINAFVTKGGALLAMGRGALDPSGSTLLLDLGVEYLGKAQYDIDYLVLGEALQEGLVSSPFLNYTPALRVRPKAGTEVLATIREPYFSRTMRHFSSHQNTPYRLEDADHPGIVRHGRTIYFAHDLAALHRGHGATLHREIFAKAVNLLNPRPLVTSNLPSQARTSLLHQNEHKRYVVHLLYGPKVLRGNIEIIEELPPLLDIRVAVDLPVDLKRVFRVPEMTPVALEEKDGKTAVSIPSFRCHTGLVFEY